MRILAAAMLAALVCVAAAAPARAHETQFVRDAAAGLAADEVYVHPAALPTITGEEADRLRTEITRAGGDVYVAVLPAAALHGDEQAADVLREIANEVRRRGVYAAVVGGQFRAGSTRGDLPRGRAAELADDAYSEHRDEGLGSTLVGFVERVGAERAGEAPASDGDDGPNYGLGALLLVGGGAAGAVALARRRRRARELAEVRELAEADVVQLGDEIRALDLDVEMPGADRRAKDEYAAAVGAYERATTALARARRPEDLEGVSSALEEGSFSMAAARAHLRGEQPPERRPPCFFDPRHGPSARDVEWTPPWGEPRLVPACAADAIRIEEGRDPETREIEVGGSRMPYYAAPPAFGGWAGGYFAGFGGLLPGILLGSMLGSGFGLGFPGDAHAGGGGIDDVGGGGDFLGDDLGGDFDAGGDFGGGDFGGGDFGGGDVGGGDF